MGMIDAIRGMLTRGVVHLSDGSKNMQTLQVETWKDDVQDDVEHVEPLGLTSSPLAGAEVFLANLGASGDHAVAFAVCDRTIRPTDLASGDTCLYDGHGNRLDLKAAGGVLNTTMDATGFLTAGVAGTTGTLTFVVAQPGPPPALVTLLTAVVSGGIVTSVTPGTAWTVAPGDVVTAVWS